MSSTESIAVNLLKLKLSKTKRISYNIPENDKTPCWDGDIFIHKDEHNTKEEIKRISIQIKGRTIDSKNFKKKVRFNLNDKDLKAYMHHDGIIFFLVYINKNDNEKHQIYYSNLVPIKIKKLLSTNNKYITLEKLPQDSDDILYTFLNFYEESQRQKGFITTNISANDLNKFKSFSFFFRSKNQLKNVFDFHKAINGNSFTIYGLDKELSILVPIDYLNNVRIEKMEETIYQKISINNILYYESFKRVVSNDKISIYFGNSFNFEIDNNSSSSNNNRTEIKFNFIENKEITLENEILDIEFFINLMKYKKLKTDNNFIILESCDLDNENASMEILNSRLKFDKNALTLFNNLKITKEIYINKFTQEEKYLLCELYEILINRRLVKENNSAMYFNKEIHVYNINILLAYIKNEQGLYAVYNFFDLYLNKETKFYQHNKNTSRFITFQNYDLFKYDNIDLDAIIDDLKFVNKDCYNFKAINSIVLDLLNTYDKTKFLSYLKYAHELIDLINTCPSLVGSDIINKNRLQTIKRERYLTFSEKDYLYQLIKTTDDNYIKIGAFILLEEFDEAMKSMNTLPPEKFEYFKTLPIYNLYNIK